jgi:diguanylate cyclase (GGDEF)-like protein/PAS domain S-box-containing protein
MPNDLPVTWSKQLLGSLLDAIAAPVFIENAQGQRLLVNRAWEEAQAARSVAGAALGYKSSHAGAALGRDWPDNTTRVPVLDDHGQPLFLVGTTRDISRQRQLQMQIDAERMLLEMLASNADMVQALESLIRNCESIFPGLRFAVLVVDETSGQIQRSCAPSLPASYCRAIENSALATAAGFPDPGAFGGQDVVLTDIALDPAWQDCRELALANGLEYCWTVPIMSNRGKLIGAFASYPATKRVPLPEELQAIKREAYLAGLVIERDIAEKRLRADQQSLQEAAQHTQTILDNMVDGVITTDSHGRIESFNKAACSMFGYEANRVQGVDVSVLMPAPHSAYHAQYMRHYHADGKARILGRQRDVIGRRRDGTEFPLAISVSQVTHGGLPTFVAIVRDITRHRQNEDEIRRLAFYDPLTELPNRRLLLDRVKQALVTAARTGQHGAMMFLDLDHFKLLNDTLGHDIGDELLQQVARRLSACVREGDSVARLGGDEFVVLLEALSPQSHEAANQAETIANKILYSLGQPYQLRDHLHTSTPSIGIVVFRDDGESMDDLLKKADVAMYQAKASGRNNARFFDPAMQAVAAAHAQLEKDIRVGLKQNQFILHYQLQFDGRGAPVGAEALVRWNHPSRGMVAPMQFIPMAEETGLILQLGQWILESACGQLALWSRSERCMHWSVSVNVSALQFAQQGFVGQVARALAQSGADAGKLKLELTESMLINDVEDIILTMHDIRSLGVGFSLDDFGTGYSSLSYLKRLPLDQLKLDQSFVRDILINGSDAAIANTVVALGHSLGLTVVAEGVETAQQREFLARIGCNAFQGYYFGHPAAADALTASEPSRK